MVAVGAGGLFVGGGWWSVGGCCWRGWWLCFSLPLGAMAFCAVERARGAPWRAARWHGRAVVGCGGSSPLGARLPPRRLTRRLTAVDTAARVGNPRGSNPGAGLYHGCCPSRVIVVGRHASASSQGAWRRRPCRRSWSPISRCSFNSWREPLPVAPTPHRGLARHSALACASRLSLAASGR